ncbi:MAG: M56 family metallopeptidase [Gemmatimonadota bacterium]
MGAETDRSGEPQERSSKGRSSWLEQGEESLSASESSHRRVLLIAVAGLIILSTSPVFGHHLATKADALLTGYDHLGRVCLIALHVLLAPVHTTFHVLLIGGLLFATWDRIRAWRGVRATLNALETSRVVEGSVFGSAAKRVGVPLDRLRIVEGLPNPAFTVGFWRPLVYVSAALPASLDGPQLEAVLAHEAAHIARRDPLRLSLMRFLACTLFYIPALRRLADDLTDEAEIEADDVAAKQSEPLVLASAILALAAWAVPSSGSGRLSALRAGSAVPFQPFVPLQRVDLLDRRVRRLAGEPTRAGTHVTRRSLGGAAATLLAIWVSGVMMAHPLPAEAAGVSLSGHEHAGSHCRHKGSFALSHLFCLGLHTHPSGTPCPHTGR